jgi:hypothetical protein
MIGAGFPHDPTAITASRQSIFKEPDGPTLSITGHIRPDAALATREVFL